MSTPMSADRWGEITTTAARWEVVAHRSAPPTMPEVHRRELIAEVERLRGLLDEVTPLLRVVAGARLAVGDRVATLAADTIDHIHPHGPLHAAP